MGRLGVASLVVILLGLVLLPLLDSLFLIYLVGQILIFVLFALAFNVVLGHAGLISFGHAAYFAIGAYACAILLTRYELALAPSLAGAVVLAGAAALVIGFFCLRLSDIYFAMLTLAFGQLVWAIAFKWDDMTGGDTGLIGVQVPDFLATPTAFYYFDLGVVTVAVAVLWMIAHSAFGRALVAIRENEQRASFVGLNVGRMRLAAFVISGTFSGLAGALYALFNRSVFVETAWWTQSAEVLIMAILGGVHSFFGPAIGAATLILLDRFTTEYTEYWPTVLGAILLAVLFFFPTGLIGLVGRIGRRDDISDEERDAGNNGARQVFRRLLGHSKS